MTKWRFKSACSHVWFRLRCFHQSYVSVHRCQWRSSALIYFLTSSQKNNKSSVRVLKNGKHHGDTSNSSGNFNLNLNEFKHCSLKNKIVLNYLKIPYQAYLHVFLNINSVTLFICQNINLILKIMFMLLLFTLLFM